MANIATQRIQREMNEVQKSDEVQKNLISIELINGSLVDLRGRISGPPDTPYEGGIFLLDIKIPETYPFNPPKVKFITRVWHPNISSATGAICLDILKDQWAAAMTIRTVLLSLQALLAAAEPDDPQDAVVAKQYKDNIDMFKKTAKHWTEVYANHLQPLLVHGTSSLYNHHLQQQQQQWMNQQGGGGGLMGTASGMGQRRVIGLKFNSTNREFDDKIKHLMEVTGSDEDKSRVALSSNSWNLEIATHSLIN